MNLYKQYLSEINGNRNTVFDDNYFINYAICGDELFIEDMYVVPSLRGSGFATKVLTDLYEIGKINGCKVITSTSKQDRIEAIRFQLKNGFKILKIDNDVLYFVREL
jgi:GNAT superfamily N-acetyltransferase